ncbi:MAG: hypothetical protein U0232_22155 [Thermomicrobiales bacterium]
MNRLLSRPVRLLFCALALLCAFPLPAVAADTPAVAKPRTYHYHAEVAATVAGDAVNAVGEGDYDFVNRAFHVVATSQAGVASVRLELLLVDGKLYTYDARQQRWVYDTLTPEEVDAFFAMLPSVPKHPTTAYAADGTEQIGGAETARWRASDAYNVLIPSLTSRGFTGSLLEETLTDELLIGKANGYLYRASILEDGKTTRLGGSSLASSPVSSKTIYTYSDFDRPVTITAPEGAVPGDSLLASMLIVDDGLAGAVARSVLAPRREQGLATVVAGRGEP